MMPDNLTKFLESDELDDTLRLAQQVMPLDNAGEAQVRSIIQEWQDTQAVANLLMYPGIMPNDIRKDALLRGLQEPENYITLAAIVGLQDHTDGWTDDERATIAGRLQTIIFNAPPAVADRASVTLIYYAGQESIDKLVFFTGYPGEAVQYNSLVTLIRLIGKDEARQQIDAAVKAGRVTSAGQKFVEEHIDRMAEKGIPLLSYIPNLKDYPA